MTTISAYSDQADCAASNPSCLSFFRKPIGGAALMAAGHVEVLHWSVESRSAAMSIVAHKLKLPAAGLAASGAPIFTPKIDRPVPSRRFTLDGSRLLEEFLARACDRVRASVQELIPSWQLDGLLLAGGYGRGEGGVLRTRTGDRPYNDLEFYVLLRPSAALWERYDRALHRLGEHLSSQFGLDVEFKCLPSRKLRQSAPSLFYYDLLMGHRRLLGSDSLLEGCDHHGDPTNIPLSEAARLLMNRCSGLLFAAEHLRRSSFGESEADFVQRNIAKAELALGDAILAAHGLYHWSCVERLNRLQSGACAPPVPWLNSLVAHHQSGVQFKLHPFRSKDAREILARRHAQICELAAAVWLWVESRRLDRAFTSIVEYALSSVNKCPETRPFKNALLSLKTFGPSALANALTHYPRERLFTAVSLLLFEPAVCVRHELLSVVQRALETQASGFTEVVGAYRALWVRFN